MHHHSHQYIVQYMLNRSSLTHAWAIAGHQVLKHHLATCGSHAGRKEREDTDMGTCRGSPKCVGAAARMSHMAMPKFVPASTTYAA